MSSIFGLFKVKRTSDYDTQPCNGAVQRELWDTDLRVVDHPDKLSDPQDRKNWYRLGRFHRVENGQICRDIPRLYWVIELPDVNAWASFLTEHNDVIVNLADRSLEIYDDYRE